MGEGGFCLAEMRIGDRLIFYATGDPREQLHVHYVSQFDAVRRVDAAAIAEISAAAQQTLVVPAAPSVPTRTTNWLPAAAALTVLVAVGLAIAARRARCGVQ